MFEDIKIPLCNDMGHWNDLFLSFCGKSHEKSKFFEGGGFFPTLPAQLSDQQHMKSTEIGEDQYLGGSSKRHRSFCVGNIPHNVYIGR